jgi:hypothetical protein
MAPTEEAGFIELWNAGTETAEIARLLGSLASRSKQMAKRHTIERTPIDLFRTLYERASRVPLVWRFASDPLRRAAHILLPVIEEDLRIHSDPSADTAAFEAPTSHVYMLLVGLAVENLAKGICVASNPNIIKNDQFSGGLKTHKLLDLLERGGVKLSQEESYLLERLETFINWAGRYPIPAKLEESLPRATPRGGYAPLNYFISSDPTLLEQFMDRLEGILDAARKNASAKKK